MFATLWLSGCVRFASQPLTPTQTAADFEARTLNNSELRRFLEKNLALEFSAWPPAYDLTNLVLTAIYYHPDMDVARAKWAGLQAGKKIAAERPNPLGVLTGQILFRGM